MFLGDTKTQENPCDDFKENKLISFKKHENFEKAMSRPFIPKTVRIRHQQKRWSDIEGPFKSKVPVCDMFPKGQEYLADRGGLYSSFSKDQVFNDFVNKTKTSEAIAEV